MNKMVKRKGNMAIKTETHSDAAIAVELPDLKDCSAVEQFMATLKGQTHLHGVRKLLGCCEQILRHTDFIRRFERKAALAVQVVNGVRTPLQAEKDHERSLRVIAQKFYSSLNYATLLKHAVALDVDLDRFCPVNAEEGTEKLVQAIVVAHIDYERSITGF